MQQENRNQEPTHELKPTQGTIQKLMNLPANHDTTKRKPNQETTTKPKPIRNTGKYGIFCYWLNAEKTWVSSQ